jgi:hypothetical protein
VVHQYGRVPVCFKEFAKKLCSKYSREELRSLEKKTSDGDCALTVFHLAGLGFSRRPAAGYFRVPRLLCRD